MQIDGNPWLVHKGGVDSYHTLFLSEQELEQLISQVSKFGVSIGKIQFGKQEKTSPSGILHAACFACPMTTEIGDCGWSYGSKIPEEVADGCPLKEVQMNEKMGELASAIEKLRSHKSHEDSNKELLISDVFGAISGVLEEHGFGYASCVAEEYRVEFMKHLEIHRMDESLDEDEEDEANETT
jgi:hypothetical protein